MVLTCGESLCGDASKVGDVLGEQHITLRRGSGQNVRVGPPTQSPFDGDVRLDAMPSQCFDESRWIHLIEKELQSFDAAAVSR
jgi:hypothetical protein